jgi:hypothetical protein
VSVTFMMYKPVGSGNSARQGPTIGVGRSTRGKLVIVRKDSSEKAQTETVVKDAAGNEVDWPTGDVQLEILRTDHAKGVFRLVVNGEAVGDVDLSTVSSLNNRSGQMDFAVLVQFLRGENLDVAVSDVGMELYTED